MPTYHVIANLCSHLTFNGAASIILPLQFFMFINLYATCITSSQRLHHCIYYLLPEKGEMDTFVSAQHY
jgi:hypothetical protein